MSKKEKLLNKAKNSGKNLSFKEFETLLKQFGFKRAKTNAGSHMKWRNKEKNLQFTAPRKNPMKQIYVKELVEFLTEI